VWFQRYFRSGNEWAAVWARAVLAVVVLCALFAARSVPPEFPDATGALSIGADSHHDQKPHCDECVLGWSAPAAAFLLFPPTQNLPNLMPATTLLSRFQAEGFHFNRPPPN
jgi:hypothetical protein